MRAIRVAVLTLPAVMWLLAGAQAAAAAPWPVAGGTVLLGYGESYAVGGAVRTHLGADIAASDGVCVRAPADATVAFRGSVPAGDGGTALAVSLDLDDGRRVTLMPLADVVVRAGERVSAGDAIAAVAGRGDASCDEPHLHVGLKSGDTYLDPATMFEGGTAAAVAAPAIAELPVSDDADGDAGGDGGGSDDAQARAGAREAAPAAAGSRSDARAPASGLAPAAPGGAPAADPKARAAAPAQASAEAADAPPDGRADVLTGRECAARPLFGGAGGGLPLATALAACAAAAAVVRRLALAKAAGER